MINSILVISLKRLYTTGKVTREKIDALLSSGKIDQESYEYIITE